MATAPSRRLSLGALLGLVITSHVTAAPSINVGLQAAFPAGPYLLELLESAAQENASSYFPLLDRVASGHFASASSEADLYSKFIDVLREDGHIATPESLSTFNLALSLRSAAPRVEAHYQYYSTAVEPVIKDTDTTCLDWVLLEGSRYCTPTLDTAATKDLFPTALKHLPFDRTTGFGKEAVLYADPSSPNFGAFHEALSQAARRGDVSYRLRYRRDPQHPSSPLPVSGYGVALSLKRTDYIVIDDREAGEDAQKPLSADVVLDDDEEVADLKPLSTSELASLGMKAASFILQSDNPFETLIRVAQDFPKFSVSLASHPVAEKFEAEYEEVRGNGIPGGINFLWMNGLQLIERQIEPFALVDMVRRERKMIDSVRSLGFNGKEAVAILGHDEVTMAKGKDDGVRYDWTDRSEEGRVLLWMNDLEKDPRYARFPKDLSGLLQGAYPGQIPPVARNVFHLVAPADLSLPADIAAIVQLGSLSQRGVPVRFGFVPLVSSPEAADQAKVAYHLVQSYGFPTCVGYLQGVLQASETGTGVDEQFFATVVAESQLLPGEKEMTLAEVLSSESYAEQVELAGRWAKRLNADTPTRPLFANGQFVPRDKNWMQGMSMKVGEDVQFMQKGLMMGEITDDTPVPDVFLKNAASRRNVYIMPPDDKTLQVLDVSRIYSEHASLMDKLPLVDNFGDASKENWALLAVIADFASEAGQDLLLSALKFRRDNPGVRLNFVHNPNDQSTVKVNAALKSNEAKLLDVETADDLQALLGDAAVGDDQDYVAALSSFLLYAKLLPGTQALILNGRVVGPLPVDSFFQADDLQQLLEYEQSTRILPVYAALADLGLDDRLSGPIAAAKITSITALSTISDLPEGIFDSAPSTRSSVYNTWSSEHSSIEVGNAETASVHIAGLLNPASEQGQRWAPILKVLSELDGVYLKLFLNPKQKLEELPVKRFFRYVLDSKPRFDDAGKVKALQATFKGLPSEALLTTAMDTPPAWLVAPKISVHDLDNIKLSSVKSDVEATYELEHILIEGHSREGKRGQPPRGAQLVLGTEKDPQLTDTIIMANLGYFQFKANPGFYNIQLKEGRSADIYTIESIGAQGQLPVLGDEGTDVALMDFQGTTLYPRLMRKPGMEGVDVLNESDEAAEDDDSILSKGMKFAEGLFGGSSASQKAKSLSAEVHAEINIFSVASGHLYERMLNIMMVSVMRHTKHTVKFWFIEQFLSPSFKDFIPHLAREYGFKYEMVTYKWPHWLRGQREKQREIWGYKILFLDVLFPLSLDKVIFVDADQVVRTDMIDLVRTDLHGAPYGFTPMCDSRVEMDGFRFWKQGYWANFLRGKPYHISALYVVDLGRFRDMAAGDRLRQQYHGLSADPNSLANLDQDLPNNMQFQIPIHSLPQEWLWCETWCSDESFPDARTIDLCNNPQTKEPKLDRARRQLPEWTVYDDEIAALDRRRRGVGQQRSYDEGINTKSRRFEETAKSKDEL
ncbi:UDP-glucose:glycoprotein glucosyltransferase-domain-containing protein [Stachybotrys elegans]|uniref:UDP-glucose:glycoprotein glucosyltransferase-domain-containing protein n=1 Tax=Stachybotrys elegans TaxID=80388 RepID=A0A8K0T2T1_9HYPO|nr:UDP-glucose:glycoprotein glucosyltransferase-domain-containing protein [Stachybotrys elegans]